MDIAALTILYRIGIGDDIGHSRSTGQWDTWSAISSADEGHRKFSHPPHSLPTTLNYSIYGDRTGNLLAPIRSSARNHPAYIYIISPDFPWSPIVLKAFTLHPANCNIPQFLIPQASASMAGDGCRNNSANKELQLAREMYERRTYARNKRKIIDLETSAIEEEGKLTDQQLGQEVDWLQDPGTNSTRVTQFVRTQAEAWRTKTILAKAMDVQSEQAEQLRTLQRFAATMTHDHMAVVESSEFKISAIHQELGSVSNKLTELIQLLKKVIQSDSKHPAPHQGGPSKA